MVCSVSVAPLRLSISNVVTMAIKKRNQKTSSPTISDAVCLMPPRSSACLIPVRSARISKWQTLRIRTTILWMTLQRTQPSKIKAMAKKKFGKKTAILVTNASQKPVTATTGFIKKFLLDHPLLDINRRENEKARKNSKSGRAYHFKCAHQDSVGKVTPKHRPLNMRGLVA